MSDGKPRILIYSNPPSAASGYGVSTKYLVEGLVKRGYDAGVLANWGYMGQPTQMPVLDDEGQIVGEYSLCPHDGYGLGEAGAIEMAKSWKADLVIANYDNWVLNALYKGLKAARIPSCSWAMFDFLPEHGDALWRNLVNATYVVPYTMYAKEQFDKHLSYVNDHIYLGVDTKIFRPEVGNVYPDIGEVTKAMFKARRGVPEDCFLVMINKMNKGDRPNLPGMLEGFKIFAENNPDVKPYLYLHTDMNSGGGKPLDRIIIDLGLQDIHRYTEAHEYKIGCTTTQMAALYNSADVLCNASLSEGFGLPIAEALSCGIPVVSTNAMAMKELLEPVCKELLVEPATKWWHQVPGCYVIPDVHGIADALEKSLSRDPEKDRVTLSAYGCGNFDWEIILDKWEVAIERTLEVSDETCLKIPQTSARLKKTADAVEVIE